jgi:hypothetical protein
VTGWQSGFPKVSTTEVLRDHLGIGRAEAQPLADRILDGGEVWLDVATSDAAETLAAALRELGAYAAA